MPKLLEQTLPRVCHDASMRLVWSGLIALAVTRGSEPCAELAHREAPGCVVLYDSRLADVGFATAARDVSVLLRAIAREAADGALDRAPFEALGGSADL